MSNTYIMSAVSAVCESISSLFTVLWFVSSISLLVHLFDCPLVFVFCRPFGKFLSSSLLEELIIMRFDLWGKV